MLFLLISRRVSGRVDCGSHWAFNRSKRSFASLDFAAFLFFESLPFGQPHLGGALCLLVHDQPLVHMDDGFRGCWPVAQSPVWLFGVVVFPPLFDQDLCLMQAVEDIRNIRSTMDWLVRCTRSSRRRPRSNLGRPEQRTQDHCQTEKTMGSRVG